MNNAAYTSAAKTWWQQNSDRLGSEMNWDTFCEVWMASLNTESIPQRISQLKEQFLSETGVSPINSQGEPDIEYVGWLEAMVEKLRLQR